MAWEQRKSGTGDYITLGDGEGHLRKISGTLDRLVHDEKFNRPNYELTQRDGSRVTVNGCARLARLITEEDVGQFLELEFEGWGTSKNGRFKKIAMRVWDGDGDVPEDEDADLPF